ncbi:DUF1657 domain-containing protein [Microaerobacter geothermalis]|uniref:DUF1657 domain-containing protein n=1 Tax=Microaerobacter geothermalis TaxID=674972 RepID=UPI001F275F72|nr:DUF1657 domain-containing protein [Microaerobacter geothermalis]MCF6094957.1 DUF1657 domain-containing protein [Microaerobacter geothermalis]
MTIGTKLQQTLASAQGVKANLKTFALDTQDQQAKNMYNQLAQTMDGVINTLQSRVNYVEQQEPQYKGQ